MTMFLLRLILWILGNSAALWIATQIAPSISFSGRIEDWIIAGLILGIANLLLKPVLKLAAGPFIIVTFGLALIAVQSVILWVTRIGLSATTGADLVFDLPWGYIWGSVIIGLANILFTHIRRTITAPSTDDVALDDAIDEKLKTISKSVDDLQRHHRGTENEDDEDYEDDEWDDDENNE